MARRNHYGWLTLLDGHPGRAIWKSFPFKAGEQAQLGILRVIVLVLAGIGLAGLPGRRRALVQATGVNVANLPAKLVKRLQTELQTAVLHENRSTGP